MLMREEERPIHERHGAGVQRHEEGHELAGEDGEGRWRKGFPCDFLSPLLGPLLCRLGRRSWRKEENLGAPPSFEAFRRARALLRCRFVRAQDPGKRSWCVLCACSFRFALDLLARLCRRCQGRRQRKHGTSWVAAALLTDHMTWGQDFAASPVPSHSPRIRKQDRGPSKDAGRV